MALKKCATDGLMPDGREAALVIRQTKNSSTGQYEDRVVYMPMVDGVLKRARQSGQVANIVSKAVYTADQFDYWVDERDEHLKHRPAFEDRGELRLVYAFAKLTSGELVVEVMGRAEVDKVRATVTSAGKSGSPWAKWYDRMALKTVLHRLARRLPCASEMYALFDAEHVPAEGRTETGAENRTTVNARPRLRDVLNNHRFTPAPQATAPETAPVPAENPTPEPEAMPPALEAAIIAFDDATDEESYQEVVEHCKTISQALSEAHRGVLLVKMTQNKERIRKTRTEAYTNAETKAPVAMADGHPEPAGPPLNIIPLANSSGTGWRFQRDASVFDHFWRLHIGIGENTDCLPFQMCQTGKRLTRPLPVGDKNMLESGGHITMTGHRGGGVIDHRPHRQLQHLMLHAPAVAGFLIGEMECVAHILCGKARAAGGQCHGGIIGPVPLSAAEGQRVAGGVISAIPAQAAINEKGLLHALENARLQTLHITPGLPLYRAVNHAIQCVFGALTDAAYRFVLSGGGMLMPCCDLLFSQIGQPQQGPVIAHTPHHRKGRDGKRPVE
uniref:RecT protein n=1 Tax=Sodalis glossinidius TaxID=63612 RepID=Q3C0K4_SODGL|nr:RecT protein [Sodalis glossinidius]